MITITIKSFLLLLVTAAAAAAVHDGNEGGVRGRGSPPAEVAGNNNYENPAIRSRQEQQPRRILGDGDVDHVLVVSEYDPTKCVGEKLKYMDCDVDNQKLVWRTNGQEVWHPSQTGTVYDYTWNRGIAKGDLCLQLTEYWRDNERFGPLFELEDRCESDELRQGFLLIPVNQYNGKPKKPKNVSVDDYVQLQVHSGMCLRAWRSVATELEVTKCNTEQYDIDDEQLWYIDGSVDDGSFKVRSKLDLTMCLDFGIYEDPWDRDGDGYEVPRLARCDDTSSRQEWRYSKRDDNEISHSKVPGYMDSTFCIDNEKTCIYDDESCEEDTDWYWDNELRIKKCDGTADQSWKIIKNDKCSREVPPRATYPKHDYFLFVSKEDPESCFEQE